MDIRTIKQLMIQYRSLLIDEKIIPDIIILYGSYAKNLQRDDSDIDIAIVSRQLGIDYFSERVKLQKLAYKVDARIEPIPISLKSYLDKTNISPLLHEIKKYGSPLF